MGIRLTDVSERSEIAFLGVAPTFEQKDSFTRRDFVVSDFEFDRIEDSPYLASLAAVVAPLYSGSSKCSRNLDRLRQHAVNILDHGCEIVVIGTAEEASQLRAIVDDLQLPANGLSGVTTEGGKEVQLSPSVSFYGIGSRWDDIARTVSSRLPGSRPNLALLICGDEPASDQRTLVRRAFVDHERIDLKRLSGGYSGAVTFRVQAQRNGGKPIPYFMKIGPRNDILAEFTGYLIGVEPFIPFYLVPPLVKENCCLGARSGLILEHYVTESESLLACAEGGRALSAIACLFSKTLNAWHRPTQTRALKDFLEPKFPSTPDREITRAAESLGCPRPLTELRRIFDYPTMNTEVPYGWIHGDLHASNVRVRGSDAVIIDMEKHCVGPLLWDPACLEASLLIDGFSGDNREGEAWLSAIWPCFRDDLFNFWSTAHLADDSSWFHLTINQIRLYVYTMQRNTCEYLAVLATALLWKANKGVALASSATRERQERELMRRGAAYIIAQELLERFEP